MSRIINILLLVSLSESVKLPANFKKCNRKHEDLKECVLEAVKNAVPQLAQPFKSIGTPSLNPLEVSEIHIQGGTGAVAADQHFKNCQVYGFDKIKFDRFEFDFNKKSLDGGGVFPQIDLNCEYEINGKVLLLPVQGKGDSRVVLHNVKANCLLHYEEEKKDGKTFIRFISSNVDIEPSLISFKFENLFNGEKDLGDNINKVVNENWKEIFTDVKKDYVELVNQILLGLLNQFFSKVSIEEAFD